MGQNEPVLENSDVGFKDRSDMSTAQTTEGQNGTKLPAG
jgi:hypothetical protein